MISVTPSNVTMLSCLKKFDEIGINKRYGGFKGQSTVLRFATMVHAVMRETYDPSQEGPLPHGDRLEMYLDAALMRAPYREDVERLHDRNRAMKLICNYMACEDDQDAADTVAVEKSALYPISVKGRVLYSLSARLDRILIRDDTAITLDYKLGARLPDTDSVLVNLAVLKMLYPGFRHYQMWIDSLVDDECPARSVFHSLEMKGRIGKLNAKVERYLQAQSQGNLPPEPGESCIFCPLASGCQGQQPVNVDDLDFED